MSLEMMCSIVGALILGAAFALRLNALKAARSTLSRWQMLEVTGAAMALGGCTGVIGEWFLPSADFHAETVLVVGASAWVVGFTRGHLCELASRLQGWDGVDRRNAGR
jgi:hypothetical protein